MVSLIVCSWIGGHGGFPCGAAGGWVHKQRKAFPLLLHLFFLCCVFLCTTFCGIFKTSWEIEGKDVRHLSKCKMNVSAPTERRPSLSFQLLLYGSCGCSSIWFVVTVALLIYKGLYLHFPPAALPIEIVSSFFVFSADIAALVLGMRGNLMGEAGATSFSLVLLFVVALGAIYYMWLQTYVMMLDLVFSATLLSCNGLAITRGLCSVHGIIQARRVRRQNFAQFSQGLSTFLPRNMRRQKED